MVGSQKSILISKRLQEGIGHKSLYPDTDHYHAKAVAFEMESFTSPQMVSSPTSPVQLDLNSSGWDGFTFEFYGTTYFGTASDDLFISRNGVLGINGDAESEGTGVVDLTRETSFGRPTTKLIAPLWDNLSTLSESEVLWEVLDPGGTDERLVIEWRDFGYHQAGAFGPDANPITFQAVLYSDGRIRFNYEDLDGSETDGHRDFGDLMIGVTGGIAATVGIWNGAPEPMTLPSGKLVPGPHSINGASSSFTTDNYLRLAWDTGGAAWDIGVIRDFGVTSDPSTAMANGLIDSLVDQILHREEIGKVFREDDVLLALKLGGGAISGEEFQADPGTLSSSNRFPSDGNPVTDTIDVNSNSIPVVNGSKVDDVFKIARTSNSGNTTFDELNLSITQLAGGASLTDGAYIVELFFSEIDDTVSVGNRPFNVIVEEQLLLKAYDIMSDHTKIVPIGDLLDSQAAGRFTGTVKRFWVDVQGNDGLQIDLTEPFDSGLDPLISGLRILRADPPRVEKIIVSSSGSTHESFDLESGSGDQIRAVPVGTDPSTGVLLDTISITFDQNVTIGQNALSLYGAYTSTSYGNGTFVRFHEDSRTATWSFSTIDEGDQIELTLDATKVTGGGGAQLDGDWTNATTITETTTNRDGQTISTFPSGNGTAGGNFVFYFSYLPGNPMRDNFVDGTDLNRVLAEWNTQDATWVVGDTTGDGSVGQADDDQVDAYWGTDFSEWPGGNLLLSTSGPISERERRLSYLAALDESLADLGMEEIWDSLNVNETAVVASDGSWSAFKDRLYRALDEYYSAGTA